MKDDPPLKVEQPIKTAPTESVHNVMADVIARHESFVNKVKNKK